MNPAVRSVDYEQDGSSSRITSMEQPILVLAMLNEILRRRLRIVLIVVVLSAIAALYSLSAAPKFISSASFSLQGSDSHRLSGLAAQIGLALPTGEGGQQSPAYYQELLTSREILAQAASASYVDSIGGRAVPTSLASVYNVAAEDRATRLDDVVSKLRSAVSTTRSRESGIIQVTVTAPSPLLAQQILAKLVGLLGDFNLKTRQSQAANERRFVEGRLADTRTALRIAEDRLQTFLQSNRGGFSNVPQLSLEHDRLMREVTLRQELYNSLSQSYEQARLDEVRDTPVITIIEVPNRPVRRASRGLLKALLVAIMIGLLVGVVPAIVRVMTRKPPESFDEERREFDRLVSEAKFWRRPSRKDEIATNIYTR